MKDRVYLEIFLRAFNEQKVYRREGYDILTYFADLGGILDLLHLSFGALTGMFSARLLKAAMISATYRIQKSVSGKKLEQLPLVREDDPHIYESASSMIKIRSSNEN